MNTASPTSLDQWLARRMRWTGPGAAPTPEALEAWRTARLRETLSHARRNSPFYAQRLEGVDIPAVDSPEAFARLPMLTPAELSEAPERLLCVSQDEIARVVTLQSSGTTGRPKRIFNTPDDLEATVDYFSWGMADLAPPGETVLVLMPGKRPGGVGELLSRALARKDARAVIHGPLEDADRAVEHCLAEKAGCLVGTPAHLNLLAAAWRRRGLPKGKIRSALLCWDTTPDAVFRNVEQAFGCRAFRHWGMVETGLGGGVDCPRRTGLHLRETDIYLEIVDPDNGRLLPDGEFGEMAVTTPVRRGMPLIRYRTGDRGRILPGRCPCGSPLRRLDPHVTRLGEGVDLGTGRLTMDELNRALYGLPGLGDFAAWLRDRTLFVRACCDADAPAGLVRETLAAIPAIRQALSTGVLQVETEIGRDAVPAVPGMEKRRIRTDKEEGA